MAGSSQKSGWDVSYELDEVLKYEGVTAWRLSIAEQLQTVSVVKAKPDDLESIEELLVSTQNNAFLDLKHPRATPQYTLSGFPACHQMSLTP